MYSFPSSPQSEASPGKRVDALHPAVELVHVRNWARAGTAAHEVQETQQSRTRQEASGIPGALRAGVVHSAATQVPGSSETHAACTDDDSEGRT